MLPDEGCEDPADDGRSDEEPEWARAVPPTKIAGPRLRAGFTDVPVIGIATIWAMERAIPMASPANPFGASFERDPKITKTNIAVRRTSARAQAASE